jgi:uncharacterized protein (TIGR02569 family)
MAGGQEKTYRAGDLVLKPAVDDDETNWTAALYLAIECDGFRVPRPIRARTGRFVFRGWQAWAYLPGKEARGRWTDAIDTCLRFHRAIAHVPKPAFLDRREDAWSVADRVVWGERQISHHPRVAPVVDRLRGVLRPIEATSQLIHGDFGGNVLFAPRLDPAVIDLAPYWRPVPFAVGVIVADAIVWEGAEMSLMDVGGQFDDFVQHLARAELRRVVELEVAQRMYGWDTIREIDAHLPLVDAICAAEG